jgi:hypothetical protein
MKRRVDRVAGDAYNPWMSSATVGVFLACHKFIRTDVFRRIE